MVLVLRFTQNQTRLWIALLRPKWPYEQSVHLVVSLMVDGWYAVCMATRLSGSMNNRKERSLSATLIKAEAIARAVAELATHVTDRFYFR